MRYLPELFENNRAWAARCLEDDELFFDRRRDVQEPPYLWIGCADSRVPANEIVGLAAGELFVHRNVANVVARDDLNLQSVLQYAIDILRVRHVIVCGHYGCGGVLAAMGDPLEEPLDSWIGHIRRVRQAYGQELASLDDHDSRWSRLCEINVTEQVAELCRCSLVRQAWQRGQELVVHGWIYDLKDGHLHDLEVTHDGKGDPGAHAGWGWFC